MKEEEVRKNIDLLQSLYIFKQQSLKNEATKLLNELKELEKQSKDINKKFEKDLNKEIDSLDEENVDLEVLIQILIENSWSLDIESFIDET